jgi:hypothetical protein
VGPHARQPRQRVLELGELHLHLGLAAAGSRGEDVENQLGPVDDPRADDVLDVLALTGRELVVEDDERRLLLGDQRLELLDLALAEVRARVRTVELLRELADDLGTRRVGKALELAQVLVERLARARPLERRSDEERPLGRGRDGDQVA